jgi:hypothetical protein
VASPIRRRRSVAVRCGCPSPVSTRSTGRRCPSPVSTRSTGRRCPRGSRRCACPSPVSPRSRASAMSLRVTSIRRASHQRADAPAHLRYLQDRWDGDVLADAHFGIYKINGTATSLRVASMRMPISGIYKINGTALSLRVASMRRAPISAPMRMHISGIYKINGTAMSLRMATSGIYEINGTAMPISGLCG